MKNKIILLLTLYAHLILLANLNANVLEDIKEKKKEMVGVDFLFLFRDFDRQKEEEESGGSFREPH